MSIRGIRRDSSKTAGTTPRGIVRIEPLRVSSLCRGSKHKTCWAYYCTCACHGSNG